MVNKALPVDESQNHGFRVLVRPYRNWLKLSHDLSSNGLVQYFIGLKLFLWAGFYIWFDFLTKYIKSNIVGFVEIFKGFDLNKICDLV